MKRPLLIVIIVLILSTLACSININLPNVQVKTGPTEAYNLSEPVPSGGSVTSLQIAMGAGKLTLSGGSGKLFEGTVRTNLTELKPVVERNGSQVTLKQETQQRFSLPTDVINEWSVKLSEQAPLDLSITAGAYQGMMDLTGLHLTDLAITDGASDTEVTFKSPNPEAMHLLSYKTGASQVKLIGLANANFDRMTFDSGAGSYTLDFTGNLQRDASVSIKSGVSQVVVIIPTGMNTKVTTEGALTDVSTSGTWTATGDTYESKGSGPLLSIDVNMGVGSLKLQQQ